MALRAGARRIPDGPGVHSAGVTLDTTKADDIALVIEEAIVSGELAPGTVLRQEQLSEQFNVSRTPGARGAAAPGRPRARLVRPEPRRARPARSRATSCTRRSWCAPSSKGSRPRWRRRSSRRRTSRSSTPPRSASRPSRRSCAHSSPATTGARSWATGCAANHAFHDVIYRVAALPLVEQLAKSARRTFSGPAVWAPGDHSMDGLYAKNAEQHRAIKQAIAAGSADGRARSRPRARPVVVRPAGDDPRAGRRPVARRTSVSLR